MLRNATEMQSRNPFEPPQAKLETSAGGNRPTHTFFLAKLASGQAKLWHAFWLVGVFGLLLASFALLVGGDFLSRQPNRGGVMRWFFLFSFYAYAAFAALSIWRCARNTRRQAWGGLARVVVGFFAGGILLLLWRIVASTFLAV